MWALEANSSLELQFGLKVRSILLKSHQSNDYYALFRLPMNGLEQSINKSMCDGKYCRNINYCHARYMIFMRTHAEDNRCATRSFLPPSNGSVTALISLPGSGNTWARHLIESAVGIYTGSVYNSQILYQQGMIFLGFTVIVVDLRGVDIAEILLQSTFFRISWRAIGS